MMRQDRFTQQAQEAAEKTCGLKLAAWGIEKPPVSTGGQACHPEQREGSGAPGGTERLVLAADQMLRCAQHDHQQRGDVARR